MVFQWKAEKVCSTACKQHLPASDVEGSPAEAEPGCPPGKACCWQGSRCSHPSAWKCEHHLTALPTPDVWGPSSKLTRVSHLPLGSCPLKKASHHSHTTTLLVRQGPQWFVCIPSPRTQLNALSMQLNKDQLNKWIDEWKKPSFEPSRKH